MKLFQFKKIDAFATAKSDGNPAGYIRLNSFADITDSQMQRIAGELKGFVNEVGYVAQTSERSFSLKFFSSECEVDFCGHATIAIMYDLIKNDDNLRQSATVEIETKRGKLTVKNSVTSEDAVYITSPVPLAKPMMLHPQKIADALAVSSDVILLEEPISIINAGLSTLIVPIKSLDAILRISPDPAQLKKFCLESDIDIVEVYTKEVASDFNDYRTRVFAPKFGYLEDPATGSGNCAFGYYLIKNNKFDNELITIEQNGDRDRFNSIKLRKEIDAEKNVRILFGGGAMTRIEGKYILQ
jgi:PhzF family phenazine biosynthesis protein